MGIQQKYIILVCLLFLISCSDNKQNDTIHFLESENKELKKQVKDRQVLLDNWFTDFASIQEEINTINTNEVFLLQMKNPENPEVLNSDKNNLLNKIEKIKKEIENKEEQLSTLGYELEGAQILIKNLKTTLEEKEKVIISLKVENNLFKELNQNLTKTNTQQEETIESQEVKIESQHKEIIQKEYEIAKMEIETYYRLSKQLSSVGNSLPQDIKRFSIKESRRELEQLKRELNNNAIIYKAKGDSILNALKYIK